MADQNVSKLGIASATLKAMGSALQRSVTSPFKGENGSNTYFKDVMLAMFRTNLGNLDLAQDRYTNGASSTPTYMQHAEKYKFVPDSIKLPSGTQAHWLGSRSGGYVTPCTAGHMLWLDDFQKSLGPDVSALLLAYDLAPEARYPSQLKQAVELLDYLVHTEGRNPSDLILGGDSAGGNLVLGLLSHLAHPHPRDRLVIHSVQDSRAFVTNAQRDMFDARTLSRWASAFLGSDSPFAGDFYNEPVLAAPEWWEPVADVVEEVLIWAGDNEILKDGIEAFAKKFTQGFGSKGGLVTTVVTPKACHDEMIFERILGYKGDSGTGSQKVLESWVRAKL
ncbi:unnamed protein product [Alternaria alternata]